MKMMLQCCVQIVFGGGISSALFWLSENSELLYYAKTISYSLLLSLSLVLQGDIGVKFFNLSVADKPCSFVLIEVRKILFQLLYLYLLDFASATECPSCIQREISVVFAGVFAICPLCEHSLSSLTY